MMSRSYCDYSIKARNLGCPPPFKNGSMDDDQLEKMREKVNRQWEGYTKKLKVGKAK